MMPRKFFLIALALALGSCRKEAPPLARVQGELIAPAANLSATPTAQAAAEDTPRRKHPKPASTQRRMVMTELILSEQAHFDPGAMPSGTKGSAADLARTNLPSIGGVPPLGAELQGYAEETFATLAGFDFILTKEMAEGGAKPEGIAAQARAQIPAGIQALDGKRVVIEGFLLPVKMNDSRAVEFLLMRNQSMCCYGVPPKINEWITVEMKGPGVKPVMDRTHGSGGRAARRPC